MQGAVEAGDLERFEEYVDIERMVASAVDDIFAAGMQEAVTSDDSSLGMFGAAFMAGMLETLKPSLNQYVVTELRRWIGANSDRPLPSDSPGSSELDHLRSDFHDLARARVAGLGRVSREGSLTRVPVRLQYSDLDAVLSVDLAMERTGRSWRVVGIEGLPQLMLDLDELEWEQLELVNSRIRTAIAEHVTFDGPVEARVRTVQTGWFSTHRQLHVGIPVRNVGPTPVRNLRVEILHPESGLRLIAQDGGLLDVGTSETVALRLRHESNELQRALVRGDSTAYEVRLHAATVFGANQWRTLEAHGSWAEAREAEGGEG